jgi:hypothetical protein
MADPKNNDVANGLLGKLYQVFSAGDSINAGPPTAPPFISFMMPGLATNKDVLDFGDLTTPDQVNKMSRFSQFANTIPQPKGTWAASSKTVGDIYEIALTQIQTPPSPLSDDEKDTVKNAQDYLYTTETKTDPLSKKAVTSRVLTDNYTAYENYRKLYQAALVGFNNSMISAKTAATPQAVQDWNLNGASYRSNVVAAWDQWGNIGNRDFVNNCTGALSTLGSRDSRYLYSGYRNDLMAAKRMDFAGNTYYPVSLYPPIFADLTDAWTKFNFSLEETHAYQTASSSSWGGGGSASWGLWSVSASVQHSSSNEHQHSETEGMSLSTELTQVALARPWLHGYIFDSQNWRWAPNQDPGLISNGLNPPDLAGLMPLLPVSMIVARNTKINLNMTLTDNKAAASSLSTSASVGWGPFSVKGNYSRSDSSASQDSIVTNSGIEIPGMVILGFVCQKLPLSPNPSKAIPDSAWG